MSAFIEDKSLRDVIMCQVKFLKTMSLVRNPVLCNVCFNVFTVVQLSVVYIVSFFYVWYHFLVK